MKIRTGRLSLGAVFLAASAVYLLMIRTQLDKLPANPVDTLNIQNKENWQELETLATIGVIGAAIFTTAMFGFVILTFIKGGRRRQDRAEPDI